MRRLSPFVIVLIVGVGLAAGSRLLTATDATFEPVASGLGETTYQMPFPQLFKWEVWPYWDHGYLIVHELETAIGTDPNNVVVYDSRGEKAREARIWFPDSTRVIINSAATTKEGNIIAAGHTEKSPGTASGFIARTDLNGTIESVITTTPFLPTLVCAASDGTVWALGGEPDKENSGEDYFMLRNYSFTKGLIHWHLPRKNFKGPISPPDGQQTNLRCTDTSVVLYSAWAREYFQIDQRRSGANSVNWWRVNTSEMGKMRLSGFAATDQGLVFASLKEMVNGPATWGLYQLTLEDASQKLVHWSPVGGTVGILPPDWSRPWQLLYLFGADDRGLAFTRTGSRHTLLFAPPIVGKN